MNEVYTITSDSGDEYKLQFYHDTYSQFFGAATDKKDGWEPLQQGLFDSSYTKYEELNKRAEEYYKHNRRFY